MLPKEAIQEFKDIYEKNTGIKLSDEDAVTLAQRFYDAMYELDHCKNLTKLKN